MASHASKGTVQATTAGPGLSATIGLVVMKEGGRSDGIRSQTAPGWQPRTWVFFRPGCISWLRHLRNLSK